MVLVFVLIMVIVQDNMSAVVVLLDSAPKHEPGFEAPETIPDPNVVYSKESEPAESAPQVPEGANASTFFDALQAILVRRLGWLLLERGWCHGGMLY